ncbi:hypothetical protein BH11BAC4_BH11BAC4_11920 [soil metagenome]
MKYLQLKHAPITGVVGRFFNSLISGISKSGKQQGKTKREEDIFNYLEYRQRKKRS